MKIPSIYIYNFIFLTIFLILCESDIIKKKYYIYIVTSYFLFFFGQRWFGGVDFAGYLTKYIYNFKFEKGYYCIQSFFRIHNIYFGNLIFIIYLFTTITSLWFFRKFTFSNYSIYIFFLSEYHIMSINPLRTYIAINLFLIGLYYYKIKNKKIVGFLVLLFGMLFHKLMIGIIFIFLMSNFFNITKIQKINNFILFFTPFIDCRIILKKIVSILFPKYLSYFGSYFDIKLSYLNILRYYIILFLFFYFLKYFNIKYKKEKFLIKGMYLFLFLIGISTNFASMHRVAYFYKIFELLFFMYLFDFKKVRVIKKIIIFTVFFINYCFIVYKDLGVLSVYEIRPLKIYNVKSEQEYLKETEEFIKRIYGDSIK